MCQRIIKYLQGLSAGYVSPPAESSAQFPNFVRELCASVVFPTKPGHPPSCMTLADGLQRRRYTRERSPKGDTETESSRHAETPSQSVERRRVAEGHQCGRLHQLFLIDPRRSIHPGAEWFDEAAT